MYNVQSSYSIFIVLGSNSEMTLLINLWPRPCYNGWPCQGHVISQTLLVFHLTVLSWIYYIKPLLKDHPRIKTTSLLRPQMNIPVLLLDHNWDQPITKNSFLHIHWWSYYQGFAVSIVHISVLLPAYASQKREVHAIRTDFAASAYSDHMVLLRVFQV